MLRAMSLMAGLVFMVTAGAEEPQWLREARAQEAKPMAVKAIKSTDGWFTAKVPAKSVEKIEKVQGSYSVEFDVGAEGHIYCEVVPDGIDMADSLRNSFLNIIKNTEKNFKVEAHALDRVDAGVWNGVPWLHATWVYRIFDGKEKLLAGVRQYSFEKNHQGVFCSMVELGYSKTMENVVRSLAETIEFKETPTTPYYTEITVITLDDENIGISQVTFTKDADGDTLTAGDLAMLRHDGDGASSQDTLRREWVRPDGTLINGAFIVAANGELVTNATLEYKDDRWVVAGKEKGQEINVQLPENSDPGTLLKQIFELREVFSSKDPVGAEHMMPMWSATDLGKLTEERTQVTGKPGDNILAVTQTTGVEKITMNMERLTASMVDGVLEAGPAKVLLRRIHVAGQL